MGIEEVGDENCQKLDPGSFSSLVQKEKDDFDQKEVTEKEINN